MRSTSRISTADVILDLDVSSKRNMLDAIAREAAHRLGRSQSEILGALQEREALGSTGLGRGIALPHARLVGDDSPLMLFVRLRRPVDYDARDEELVDIVILVLWPEASPEGFLPALAETCQTVRDPQALRQLRRATSAEEVVALLDRYRRPAAPDRAENA